MSELLLARVKRKHKHAEPIVAITAYDYFTALLAEAADVDFVLVGDSLGNVIQGAETTVGVTLEQMIYHTQIVCRHFPANRVVVDMPFGTFKIEADQTVANCIRAVRESGCAAVKFEGATNDNLFATRTLTQAGVPVLGHLGLLPQRVHAEGGFRMQGRTAEQAEQLRRQAAALEEAGAFAMVLECVVPEVAAQITGELSIPTIGIGSGPACSGQILVVHDILGMLPGDPPSFVKRYAQLYEPAVTAVQQYAAQIRERSFPEAGSLPPSTSTYGSHPAGRTQSGV